MIFNWILINKLAIGTPISSNENSISVQKKGIKSVLDLRNKDDFKQNRKSEYIELLLNFHYENIQLPDHKTGRLIENKEIHKAVNMLESLFLKGPVYMHCHASVERSPIISVAYLHLKKGYSLTQACDFVKQQNISTNINLRQLKYIN